MANLTLKIEKKETTVSEVEIPIPAFWVNQEQTVYIGLLDEKTVVEIVDDKWEKSIRNFDNTTWTAGIDRVANAYQKYHGTTESIFLEKFDEVVESLSLHPKLVA